MRLAGRTWPEVAAALTGTGLAVTDAEARAYWHRFAGGREPMQIALEGARAAQAAATEAQQRAADEALLLRQELAEAEAERDASEAQATQLRQECDAARAGQLQVQEALKALEGRLVALERERDAARAQAAQIAQERDQARAGERQALDAQAALRSQLASVTREVEQIRPVAEARGRASVELGKAGKERDQAVARAAGWERWAREVLGHYDAGSLTPDVLAGYMDAVRKAVQPTPSA